MAPIDEDAIVRIVRAAVAASAATGGPKSPSPASSRTTASPPPPVSNHRRRRTAPANDIYPTHRGSDHPERDEMLRRILREGKELQDALSKTGERLSNETRRADLAESKLREAKNAAHTLSLARLAAEQEAARYMEEINRYKVQLDMAQKEITKAQEILNSLEEERALAEESAARARDTARKLVEEAKMRGKK